MLADDKQVIKMIVTCHKLWPLLTFLVVSRGW